MASHDPEEWKDATKRETLDSLTLELDKLLDTAPKDKLEYWRREFDSFKEYFKRFLHAKPTITWNKLEPLPEGTVRDYADLPRPQDSQIGALLSKLVVVKLNGGLGTTMGCKGPKGAISVRDELTFLDLTMQQMEALNRKYGVDVPLVLMNSFNTDEDTKKIIRKYKHIPVSVYTFNQSCYPRINKETLLPIATTVLNNHEAWYPPGHGDFFESFVKVGLLELFLGQGKEYCFVSNMDNLCATVDLNILNFLHQKNGATEFIMEVVEKTRGDVKGTVLTQYDGKPIALDVVQVPKENEEEFRSISKFKVFNTNNLWASLPSIKRLVDAKKMEMEIVVNQKHLNHGSAIDVLQLETCAGAAIKCFDGAIGINVPRSRFLPVKKSQDLFLAMSNLYDLENGTLTLSDRRLIPTPPVIKLGAFFDKVQDFSKRFPTIPNIVELDQLTVSGDVWFGRGITLKGTVIIVANHGERIDIPSGSILENKILSGNLRILDH